MVGSLMRCPTLRCPKMPPWVRLVDPVHTATGWFPWLSTRNLLCCNAALLGAVRQRTTLSSPPAVTAARLSSAVWSSAPSLPSLSRPWTTRETSAPAAVAAASARRPVFQVNS